MSTGTAVTSDDLSRLRPVGGWPEWVTAVPYVAAAHPGQRHPRPIREGANCQRYAYALLGLFGRSLPPHRSSELWADPAFVHVSPEAREDLDLALFNATDDSWGAHVAVVWGDRLLHLCVEEGRPAIWGWRDFASRERYATVVGIVRVPPPVQAPVT